MPTNYQVALLLEPRCSHLSSGYKTLSQGVAAGVWATGPLAQVQVQLSLLLLCVLRKAGPVLCTSVSYV